MFADRGDARRELAAKLRQYAGSDAAVYGLPRGGVVTARVVADELGLPLGLIVARKIGHPNNPEYAVGAVAETGELALNAAEADSLPNEWLQSETHRQLEEARRRRSVYAAGRPDPSAAGRVAIVVDDGIATGYTMQAALMSLRKQGPLKLVVASPVASDTALQRLGPYADELAIVTLRPEMLAIGQFYRDFSAVEDRAVIAALREGAAR